MDGIVSLIVDAVQVTASRGIQGNHFHLPVWLYERLGQSENVGNR